MFQTGNPLDQAQVRNMPREATGEWLVRPHSSGRVHTRCRQTRSRVKPEVLDFFVPLQQKTLWGAAKAGVVASGKVLAVRCSLISVAERISVIRFTVQLHPSSPLHGTPPTAVLSSRTAALRPWRGGLSTNLVPPHRMCPRQCWDTAMLDVLNSVGMCAPRDNE